MRPIILLAAVSALFIAAAFNVNRLLDALIAAYSSAAIRGTYGAILGVIGVGALVLALVMISRRADRQIDQDFPNTEAETVAAQNLDDLAIGAKSAGRE
jgi:hypothetical protein